MGLTKILDARAVPGHPALSGFQLRCGARPSIPFSSIASCASVREILPSFAEDRANRPFSKRFENTAVRQELATGASVGGKMHSQKAARSITALEKWLERNPTARPGDRAAAENVIKDTRNAIGW